MTATDNTKRWTPITKPGGIYCSPGCGCNCTKANHDQAQRLGAALAERMGPGWRADVWENGRWHYAAILDISDKEHIRIHNGARWPTFEHIEGQDKYSVYLNTRPQFITEHTDPHVALDAAIDALREHIESLQAAHNRVIQATRKATTD